MAVACQKTWSDYLRLQKQLLPPGYAWQWAPSSVGLHLLAAFADEFARVHNHFCAIAEAGIERFGGEISGWSAADYEHLLWEKFGIVAVVTDGLLPFDCESSCEAPLLDERIIYVYLITVDDVSSVPDSVRNYLREYQQSHTHFHIRDRQISATTDYDHKAFTCESSCEDELYERDWHAMTYRCDWSWAFDDISHLPGWPAIAAQIRDYTTLRRDDAPH